MSTRARLASGRRGWQRSHTTSYDRFAPHFDAWQRAFGAPYDDLILPRLLAALERVGPDVRSIVDLGVGTGDLAIALARRGYRVIGVDRSAPMLAVARDKLRAAGLADPPVLVEQDLRTLRLDAPVDAAVCVYTVMNQLTGDGDLERALHAVHQALVPGGLFLFELNLPAAYERYWSGTETIQLADAVVVRTHGSVPGTPVIEAQVTIQRRHDGDGRSEEVQDRIAQRPFDDGEVEAALAGEGFALVAREEFNPFDAPFDAAQAPMKALWTVRRAA